MIKVKNELYLIYKLQKDKYKLSNGMGDRSLLLFLYSIITIKK